MLKNLEINKSLCVGTSHITKEDSNLLFGAEDSVLGSGLCSCSSEYGGFLYTKHDPAYYKNLSNACKTLITLALENDCVYIQFDCDGPVIEGYETFEW